MGLRFDVRPAGLSVTNVGPYLRPVFKTASNQCSVFASVRDRKSAHPVVSVLCENVAPILAGASTVRRSFVTERVRTVFPSPASRDWIVMAGSAGPRILMCMCSLTPRVP